MKHGLLWFDNSGRPLAVIVAEAAERYRHKYGCEPNVCYVNPAQFEAIKVGWVRVVAAPYVLPHHLWVGLELLEEQTIK